MQINPMHIMIGCPEISSNTYTIMQTKHIG